jgi:hypothetical protein
MATDQALVVQARRAAAHPAKLIVDVVAVAAAMVPLWSHQWLLAALVAIVPGLIATAGVTAALARADRPRPVIDVPGWVQAVRLVALGLAVWAAWTHHLTVVIAAILIGAVVLLPRAGRRQLDPEAQRGSRT